MNPQSDPTPGLRLPQPSINSGAAQPFMTPAQSPIQTPAVHPQVQATATQPLQQNVPNSRPEHHAQPEVSVAQAQVASVMHTSTPETEPMINPNIPVQSSQPAQQPRNIVLKFQMNQLNPPQLLRLLLMRMTTLPMSSGWRKLKLQSINIRPTRICKAKHLAV